MDYKLDKYVHLHPANLTAINRIEVPAITKKQRSAFKTSESFYQNQLSLLTTVGNNALFLQSNHESQDPDIINLPAIAFENKANDWSVLAKDLCIVSGFLPKNLVLLRKIVTNDTNDPQQQPESPQINAIVKPNPSTQSKLSLLSYSTDFLVKEKNRPNAEEIRMKRRKEMADKYENYDGKRARNARERALRRKKLIAAMRNRAVLNADEIRRRRAMLQTMLQETNFIPPWHFQPELSFTGESIDEDPFGIFIEYEFEDPKKSLAIIPSGEQNEEWRMSVRTIGSPTKRNIPKKSLDLSEAEKGAGFTRRKSDCSSYAGGLSRFEQKTQNLVVELARQRETRDKPNELGFSLQQSRRKEPADSPSLNRSLQRRPSKALVKGASFSFKNRQFDLKVPLLLLNNTSSKSKPVLKPDTAAFHGSSDPLPTHQQNNFRIPSVNEVVDNPSLKEDTIQQETGQNNFPIGTHDESIQDVPLLLPTLTHITEAPANEEKLDLTKSHNQEIKKNNQSSDMKKLANDSISSTITKQMASITVNGTINPKKPIRHKKLLTIKTEPSNLSSQAKTSVTSKNKLTSSRKAFEGLIKRVQPANVSPETTEILNQRASFQGFDNQSVQKKSEEVFPQLPIHHKNLSSIYLGENKPSSHSPNSLLMQQSFEQNQRASASKPLKRDIMKIYSPKNVSISKNGATLRMVSPWYSPKTDMTQLEKTTKTSKSNFSLISSPQNARKLQFSFETQKQSIPDLSKNSEQKLHEAKKYLEPMKMAYKNHNRNKSKL